MPPFGVEFGIVYFITFKYLFKDHYVQGTYIQQNMLGRIIWLFPTPWTVVSIQDSLHPWKSQATTLGWIAISYSDKAECVLVFISTNVETHAK